MRGRVLVAEPGHNPQPLRRLDVNIASNEGKTLLILAAENSLADAVRGVLEKSVKKPVNLAAHDKRRWTALMWCAENGLADCCALMLEKAAAADLKKLVDAQNEFGRTALHMAAGKGRVDIVKLLLRAGAEFAGKDRGACFFF